MSGRYLNDDDPAFMLVPIQVRENVRVDVRIPRDLTTKEAERVAAVIVALAQPTTPTKGAASDV